MYIELSHYATPYAITLKVYSIVKSLEEDICNRLSTMNAREIAEIHAKLISHKECLELARQIFYSGCTAGEITSILNEELIPSDRKYATATYVKHVLPKDIYCNHEQWSKDPKLQALMPTKRF